MSITKTALATELGITRFVLDRKIKDLTSQKALRLRAPQPRKPVSDKLANAIRESMSEDKRIVLSETYKGAYPVDTIDRIYEDSGQTIVIPSTRDPEDYDIQLAINSPLEFSEDEEPEESDPELEENKGSLINTRMTEFRKEALAEFGDYPKRVSDHYETIKDPNPPTDEEVEEAIEGWRKAFSNPIVTPEIEREEETLEPDPPIEDEKESWLAEWKDRQAKAIRNLPGNEEPEKVIQEKPGQAIHPMFKLQLDVIAAIVIILTDAICCWWIAYNSFDGQAAIYASALFFLGGMASGYAAVRFIATEKSALADDWSNGLMVYQIALHVCALEVLQSYSFLVGKIVIAIGFAMSMKVLAKSFRNAQIKSL